MQNHCLHISTDDIMPCWLHLEEGIQIDQRLPKLTVEPANKLQPTVRSVSLSCNHHYNPHDHTLKNWVLQIDVQTCHLQRAPQLQQEALHQHQVASRHG